MATAKSSGAVDVASIMKQMKKQFGDQVVNKGVTLQNTDRVPTGWFPFDLATGGGIPLGRISILYGPESSLKTSIALRALGKYQKKYPKKTCVFVDLENHYDPVWGKKLGVNNDKLVYVLPDYAEQAVDIIDGLIQADDVGMIVVDSLAAMITTNEANSSADKAVVGGSGLVVGKLYRKVTLGLSKARREGRYPIVLVINQVRIKVGVMYGDPETMPGGNAFKFASSLTVRVYGKDEVVPKINATMPAYKVCSGIIKKYKVPITARTFEMRMGALNSAVNGIKLAEVDDWNTVWHHLVELEWASKKGTKVEFLEEIYPNIAAVRKRLYDDTVYFEDLKKLIIQAVLERNAIDTVDEEEDLDEILDADADSIIEEDDLVVIEVPEDEDDEDDN